MDKSSSPGTNYQLHAKAWLQQAQAELDKAAKVPRSGSNPVQKNRNGFVIYLIFGFIFLELITLVIILAFTLLDKTGPSNPDTIAALAVSSTVEQAPVLPEPSPPMTSTPQPQDIIESHSPAPSDVEAAPPIEPVPAQTSELKFRGVELTQGIQVFEEPENAACQPDPNHPNYIFCNNSIPMVAGRHTLVRAYLACNGICPTSEVVVRLHLFKDGQEQDVLTRHLSPETLEVVSNLPMSDLRIDLAKSVNFEFFPPPAWLSGQITFQIEAVSQPDTGQLPATMSITKDFVVRKPLRIAYLPIDYQGLRPPDPVGMDYWLLRMYPVADVEYYRLPMPDLVWKGDVGKSEVLRKLLYTYWFYAQSHSTEDSPDQLFGWLPQELYNGGASDPFWCPYCAGPHSSRVAFGGLRPEQDIGGPRILAHEIAHNLGAQHAWSPTNKEDASCFKAEGADIRVDPEWPYAQTAHIQEVGLDLYSDPPIVYPSSSYDMMAYCTQPWISPHTYRKIFDSPFLQPNSSDALSLTNFQPQVEATDSGTLLISGLVFPDGTVSRPEVIRLEGDAFPNASGFTPPLEFAPPAGDDYCLNVQGHNDVVLAQYCFDVGFVNMETGLPTEPSPFFFTLPTANVAEVEKVAITKNQSVVVVVTPSNNPPEVNVTFPNGGEVLGGAQTITWDARDDDGDPLHYDLLYSPDGGQNWLPLALQLTETSYTFNTSQILSGENMLIRVIANDGFNTTSDESDATFTIQALPQNSMSMVGPTTVKPGQTFEVDVVANQVTEPGLFGIQFELDFDPNQVQVNDIRPHPALELVVDKTIDNSRGHISFVASRQGRVSDLTGQITLTTLTVTAKQNQGQPYLDLYNVVAGARGGIPTAISEVHGLTIHVVE